jgi:aldose 1-epimerase
VDAELLPDGRVVSVGGTPFDFRTGKAIGRDILAKDEQLRLGMGFDHNFIVRGPAGTLRPCATVTEPLSGRAMTVETTAHAVQFYTGNQHRHQVGKNGAQYDVHCGFCLETQFYPDSLRHPQFPSPVFKAGETFRQTTRFRFNT